jgi:hypothetical protein
MIGKVLVTFIILMAVTCGLLAYRQGTIPNNIWLYIVGIIILLIIVNVIMGILSNNDNDIYSVKEIVKDLDGTVHNVPGIGARIDLDNGKSFLIRSQKNDYVAIHEVKDGKVDNSPLFVPRNQAAYEIKRKARR